MKIGRSRVTAAVAVACVVGAAIVVGLTGRGPLVSSQPDPSLGTEMAGDGIFRIGIDVATGTWHTDGPRTAGVQHFSNGATAPIAATPCTWGMGHDTTDQGREKFITDDDSPPHQEWGPRDVTIPAGTRLDFISGNCRTWHLVSAG